MRVRSKTRGTRPDANGTAAMRQMSPFSGDNAFKLGLFGVITDGGSAITLVPERRSARWDEIAEVAQQADRAGATTPVASAIPSALDKAPDVAVAIRHAACGMRQGPERRGAAKWRPSVADAGLPRRAWAMVRSVHDSRTGSFPGRARIQTGTFPDRQGTA